MSETVPAQHPAVVLRSHYRNLRSLMAVLLVAVVGLTATVVVLSVDGGQTTTTSSVGQPAARLGDPLQVRTQPPRQTGKPDESAIAAAITSARAPVSAPDESKVAAAISKQADTGPLARARAYQEALKSMTPQELEAAYGIGK